jgi:hypothetical protein
MIQKINKNILELHEINFNILQKIKNDKINGISYQVITFDDGLYSQYYYYNQLREIFPYTTFIYFISTDIINQDADNTIIDIDCRMAHIRYFDKGDCSAYMTITQIKNLADSRNCIIGGHGHKHYFPSIGKHGLKKDYQNWKDDFHSMERWFKDNNLELDYYCCPYNIKKDLYLLGIEFKGVVFAGNRTKIDL